MTQKPSVNYRVYKTIAGKVRVKHACPHCMAKIENEITEAGHSDKCPECGAPFIVPGEREKLQLEQQLAAQRQERLDADQERKAEQQQRQQEREQEKQRQAAEQKAFQERSAKERSDPMTGSVVQPKPFHPVEPHVRSNVSYPTLEFYASLLKAFGWVILLFGGLAVLVIVVRTLFSERNVDSTLISIAMFVIMTAAAALPFFAASELIGLAIDARRDLARIADATEAKR